MRNCSNVQERPRSCIAEGKLFVTEMQIRDEEAVEEEHAYSDGEPDDAASDPESVLQEAATEPPLPPPPTPPPPRALPKDPEDPEVKRRRDMLGPDASS